MDWSRIFSYDGADLYWKVKPKGKVQVGMKAGFLDQRGYLRVKYQQKTYRAHRVIYELCVGPIPEGCEVDHIDRDPSNNRLENLRVATPSQNACNRGLFTNNTTGLKGVHLSKKTGKYLAYITVGGERVHLGTHETKEEAFEAYKEAARAYHKKFSNIEGNENVDTQS